MSTISHLFSFYNLIRYRWTTWHWHKANFSIIARKNRISKQMKQICIMKHDTVLNPQYPDNRVKSIHTNSTLLLLIQAW